MRLGILGGGQLGRMLALAGYPLGLQFRVLDPTPQAPAGSLAEQVVAGYDDAGALDRFARDLDLVTYEFENVPLKAVRRLATRLPVFPPPRALEVSQDRLEEKRFLESLQIPTAPFAAVQEVVDLEEAVERLGSPAVLKSRRFGYDGKGQFLIREAGDVERAWETLGGRPLIIEGFVSFERELSIIAVRSRSGEKRFYPLVENHHRDGILRRSLAPAAAVPTALQSQAEAYATRILEELDYVGVLAVELFQFGDHLVANEMAPRVHNSGHWTIEGAATSQFANHLRAVLDLPLGSAEPTGYSGMINLIGDVPERRLILEEPFTYLHLYDKSPRPGRKLGHVTVNAADPEARDGRLSRLEGRLT